MLCGIASFHNAIKKEFPCEAPNKHSERVKEQQPAGRESKKKKIIK